MFLLRFLLSVCLLLLLSAGLLPAQVLPGADVLRERGWDVLRGKRVGLICNQTSLTASGEPTRVAMRRGGVNLVALFAPEHGIDGTIGAGRSVGTVKDRLTGVTVFSLYGSTRKPTPAMLRGLDVLVFDLQDIGSRSYTYISTMVKGMEAAGEVGIDFIVLDRPNPLGGETVEGPAIEREWISFVGQLPVAYRHGMTAGELARMANDRGWLSSRCRLSVVPMRGWSRGMTWQQTGLRWVRTSPNIPRDISPFYYAAVGIAGNLGGLDLGINTPAAFQRFCSPRLDATGLAAQLRAAFPGVRAGPISGDGGKPGVALGIDPRADTRIIGINAYLMAAAVRADPRVLDKPRRDRDGLLWKVYGSRSIDKSLTSGESPAALVARWEGAAARFRSERASFLMY